jgi:hypothetical protein
MHEMRGTSELIIKSSGFFFGSTLGRESPDLC